MIDEISKWVEQTVQALNKLEGAPAIVLVLMLSWVAGWICKRVPAIPNQSIPVVVVLCAALANVLLSDFYRSSLPFRIWLVRNAVVGMIVGAIAWVVHRYGWKIVIAQLKARFPSAAKDFDTQFTENNGGSAQPKQTTTTEQPKGN